jgi:hypothetical protein
MVKSAQPERVGMHAPTLSLYIIYHHKQRVVVYAPAEREDTFPLFHLSPNMYSVGRTHPLFLTSTGPYRIHLFLDSIYTRI